MGKIAGGAVKDKFILLQNRLGIICRYVVGKCQVNFMIIVKIIFALANRGKTITDTAFLCLSDQYYINQHTVW